MTKARDGTTKRGGARPGAGRPTIYQLSERERQRIIKAMRRSERQHRKSMGAVLAEMVFSDDKRVSATGMQVYLRDVLAKSSQQDMNVNKREFPAPDIFLPEQKPDPARQHEVDNVVTLKHRP